MYLKKIFIYIENMDMKINLYSKLSSYMLYELFCFISIRKKLTIIKYNKKIQKKMDISEDDYIALSMFYYSEIHPNPNFIKHYQQFIKNYPEFPKDKIKNLFILSFEKQVEKMGYNYYNLSIFDDLFYDILHKRKITPYKISFDQNDLNQQICDELCQNKIEFLDIYLYTKVNNDYLKIIFECNSDTIRKLNLNYLFEEYNILLPLKNLNEISFNLIIDKNQNISFLSFSNISNLISKLQLKVNHNFIEIPDLCKLKELTIQSDDLTNIKISNKTLQQLELLKIENIFIQNGILEENIELNLKKLSLINKNNFNYNCPYLEEFEIENIDIDELDYNFVNNVKIFNLKLGKSIIKKNDFKFISYFKRLEKLTIEFPQNDKEYCKILKESFPKIKHLSLFGFLDSNFNNLILESISKNFEYLEKLEIFTSFTNSMSIKSNLNYYNNNDNLKFPLHLKSICIQNFQNLKINLSIFEKIFDNLIELNITECPITLKSLPIFQNEKKYPKLKQIIIKNSLFTIKLDKNAMINFANNLKYCKLIEELVIIDEGMLKIFVDIIISNISNMEKINSLTLSKKTILNLSVQSDIYERYSILQKLKFLNKNNIYINF